MSTYSIQLKSGEIITIPSTSLEAASSSINHQDILGILGSTSYYHLSSSDYAKAAALSSSLTTGYFLLDASNSPITGNTTFSTGVTVTATLTGSSNATIAGNLGVSSGATIANTLVCSSGVTVAEGLDVTSSFTANDAVLTSGIQATTGTFSSGVTANNISIASSLIVGSTSDAASSSIGAIYIEKSFSSGTVEFINQNSYFDMGSSGLFYVKGIGINLLVNSSGDSTGGATNGYIRNLDTRITIRENFGTISELEGMFNQYGSYGPGGADVSGTITNAYGIRHYCLKRASTIITNNYGEYIQDVAGTNAYGLYIKNVSGSTLQYDIYADGTNSNNYLAGQLGIGTASPTSQLHMSSSTIRIATARTPAASASTGRVGEICWSTGYVYVCVAADTWARASLSTW